ncbi:MAG: DUF6644 family protein [Candidatus Acidiferrales bacterium]
MLLPFFGRCEHSWIGQSIQSSVWLFPVIESIHLVGLGVIAGSVLIVDMQLLGIGLRGQSAEQVAENARPWMMGSLALMFASGILLFLSEATKCYYSFPFWFKMSSLALAIAFTFTLKSRVIRKNLDREYPLLAKATAIVSLGLWFGVAWGGRWIGFS